MSVNERTKRFREAIAGFIEERRTAKIGDESEPDTTASAKYEYDIWLADAARRAGQIQAVTHVLKATHPDAKGSSLYVDCAALPARNELGSHVLGAEVAEDIVGNAAALDVYKLLKVAVEGRRLLDWLLDDDADLLAALSGKPEIAAEHATAFKALYRQPNTYSSHANAKQVYWCVGDDAADDSHYHLLQPLFSSSLVHAMFEQIQHARYDESFVEARKARREKKPHALAIPEYPGLAERKLGGTKPQNISQLNSERGGKNYLLASLPPQWKQDSPRSFHHMATAMGQWFRFEGIKPLLYAYANHLKSYDQRTMQDTIIRERMERQLGASLAEFGAVTMQQFEPGWTRDAQCKLALCEKLWLDQKRYNLPLRDAEADPEGHQDDLTFNHEFDKQEYPDQVAANFATWLNEWLRKQDLPMSDIELRHYARSAIVEVANWPNPIRRDLPSKRSWAQEVNL